MFASRFILSIIDSYVSVYSHFIFVLYCGGELR
jgi:hypothetical protein